MVEEEGMHPWTWLVKGREFDKLGSFGAAAQWLPRPPYPFGRDSRGIPPSVFTYKYKGGQQQERKGRGKEQNRRGKELKTERKKKRKTEEEKKKNTEKQRREVRKTAA